MVATKVGRDWVNPYRQSWGGGGSVDPFPHAVNTQTKTQTKMWIKLSKPRPVVQVSSALKQKTMLWVVRVQALLGARSGLSLGAGGWLVIVELPIPTFK